MSAHRRLTPARVTARAHAALTADLHTTADGAEYWQCPGCRDVIYTDHWGYDVDTKLDHHALDCQPLRAMVATAEVRDA